ncbi:alpha-(1,3)-fucosyltransferase C-like [Phlebotomus argentipes]|uniref:alpha-(1,3)-fucosyltransferase C-like n=1 Tax=Phlebotomus argentipes TaxID=94469 RepID=UPI00289351E2|nr:alpha-(1,3)-fucosyltransferase C-like [Phlebotomus argentipes]
MVTKVQKYILLYDVPTWMRRLPIVNLDVECVVTSNKTFFADLRKFDAIVFTGSTEWLAEKTFPRVRSAHQYYVFADLESPFYTLHRFSNNPSLEIYNLTMTYRRDSDIFWPYGFISNANESHVSDLVVPVWKTPVYNDYDREKALAIAKKKGKTVAWFVSHCDVKSKRNKLVSAMKEHVNIDIYGSCGSLKCSVKNTENCYELVEKEYFFYLSFENSLCKDYLTEKVFNIMKYYVVPVVFGGANYSHFLPPQSYIDANDFATAKDLANFLRNLANNPEEYIKYFWWKSHYKTLSTLKSYNNLCKKLHEFSSGIDGGQFIRSYKNMSHWLNDNQCEEESRIKFT